MNYFVIVGDSEVFSVIWKTARIGKVWDPDKDDVNPEPLVTRLWSRDGSAKIKEERDSEEIPGGYQQNVFVKSSLNINIHLKPDHMIDVDKSLSFFLYLDGVSISIDPTQTI